MHSNNVEFEVYGNYALFSDPIMRVGGEKCSYQVPTYEALKGILISVITEVTDIAQLDSGLYFITGAFSPINGVAGVFNTLYLIIVFGPWRYEIAISANADAIYYRFYNPSDGIEKWLNIKGV